MEGAEGRFPSGEMCCFPVRSVDVASLPLHLLLMIVRGCESLMAKMLGS